MTEFQRLERAFSSYTLRTLPSYTYITAMTRRLTSKVAFRSHQRDGKSVLKRLAALENRLDRGSLFHPLDVACQPRQRLIRQYAEPFEPNKAGNQGCVRK